MSQTETQSSNVLFTGPTVHASGVQLVSDSTGEVSIYFTTTRHAFSQNATQVRAVNELVARVVMNERSVQALVKALEGLGRKGVAAD